MAFSPTMTWLAPWSLRVHVGGAAREGARLVLYVQTDSSWQGRIRFDHPRHRAYTVRVGKSAPRRYLGADLVSGLPLTLGAGEKVIATVE